MKKVYSNEMVLGECKTCGHSTESENYNGWSNYATWRVNLELVDGNDGLLESEYESISYLADSIKETCYEYIESSNIAPDCNKVDNILLSYASAFMSDVNWYEIAEHIASDYPSIIKSDNDE